MQLTDRRVVNEMWLKTTVGKRVQVQSTQTDVAWEGTLVDVDTIGLTINDAEKGITFVPYPVVFSVRILER